MERLHCYMKKYGMIVLCGILHLIGIAFLGVALVQLSEIIMIHIEHGHGVHLIFGLAVAAFIYYGLFLHKKK